MSGSNGMAIWQNRWVLLSRLITWNTVSFSRVGTTEALGWMYTLMGVWRKPQWGQTTGIMGEKEEMMTNGRLRSMNARVGEGLEWWQDSKPDVNMQGVTQLHVVDWCGREWVLGILRLLRTRETGTERKTRSKKSSENNVSVEKIRRWWIGMHQRVLGDGTTPKTGNYG